MSIAFIFPGQGSQYVGMGKDFYEKYESSREIYQQASEALGFDMPELCFEENDRLNQTEYTQAALVTTSVAMLKVLEEHGIVPDVCAGHSLGEYAALVASHAMSFENAVKTVRQRGILMQQAVPAGQGSMCAVIGSDAETIQNICEAVGDVFVANYNCPGQIVITGKTEAVEQAAEKLKEAGAKRCIVLNVSGPFHSPFLKEAGDSLYEFLADIRLEDTVAVPYIANVNAEYVREPDGIRELLREQVSDSVRWEQTIRRMIEDGIDTFIEIGPGKTLTGFMKRINKGVQAWNVGTVEELEKLLEVLK